MLVDYHVHTNTSHDSTAKILDYCVEAIENNIGEICITNHHELMDKPGKAILTPEDILKLRKELDNARRRFPGLGILFGTEVGYFADKIDIIREFIEENDFDYVIGSVHHLDGDYIYRGDLKKVNIPYDEKVRRYFKATNEAIRTRLFDCIGHFDLLCKGIGQVPYSRYSALIDECAQSMVETGTGFEVNTRGWERPYNHPNPHKDVIRAFYEAGVRRVTVGSDSHNPGELGFGIQRAYKLLKGIGFTHVSRFAKRNESFLAL